MVEKLHDLYDEWRQLSESEGEAIRASAWERVQQHQQAKLHLQTRILQATESWETTRGSPPHDQELTSLDQLLSDLLELENKNNQALEEQRRQTHLKQTQLESHTRLLRGLQKSYGKPRQPFWESYS